LIRVSPKKYVRWDGLLSGPHNLGFDIHPLSTPIILEIGRLFG